MVVKLEIFTSKNCPYCPKALNAIDEAVNELGDNIDLHKYDIEEDIDKVKEYDIMSVPTIVVNGRIAFREAPEPKRLIAKIKRNMK